MPRLEGLPAAAIPYKFASSTLHAFDVFYHFDTDSDGGLIMKCAPEDRRLRLALNTSNLLFLAILWEVNAVCEFGLDAELTRVFMELVPKARGLLDGGFIPGEREDDPGGER